MNKNSQNEADDYLKELILKQQNNHDPIIESDIKEYTRLFYQKLFSDVKKLEEKEIRSDRMLVDLNHKLTIANAEYNHLLKSVKHLMLFVEQNGKPVDGFRFREEALELIKIILKK